MATVVNLNGDIVAPEAATISVFDHGFLYGESIYETVRTYDGRCFRLGEHLARLERSGELIGLALPRPRPELAAEVERTVAATGEDDCAVRITVTRGEGAVGLDASCGPPNVIIMARSLTPLTAEQYERGVSVVVSRTVRNPVRALNPEIKSGNFLNNIFGLREARARGGFEAIMLNQDAAVTEATQSNIFVVTGGELTTPEPRSGLLRGITRELVLAMCRRDGLAVVEREIFVTELYGADEMFLTSSLKEAVPVTSLDGRPVGNGEPGAITRRVMALYRAEIERFLASPPD